MSDQPAQPSGSPPPAAPNDGLASVVPVDRRDDIAAVCGAIDSAPTFAVVLHAPRGNRQAAGQLGMRRIVRHAEDSGRVVAIATKSRSLASRARQEGVPVGRKPDRIRWDAGGKRVLWLGPASIALPSLGRYAQLILLLLAVLALAGIALAAGSSAEVTLAPPLESESAPVLLTAATDQEPPDLSESAIDTVVFPLEEVSTTRTVTLARATTGVGPVPAGRATVLVTMTNPGSTDVEVPKGAGLATADGIAFMLDLDTTVPAGGSASQQVSAVEPGPAGNVAAATITVWTTSGFEALQVTNPAAATGGTTENRAVVSVDDVTALQELALTLQTSEELRSTLAADRPTWAIYGRTITVVATPGPPSPGIGQPGTVVFVTVTLAISGFGIPPAAVESIAESALDDRDGRSHVPGSVTAVETGREQADTEDGLQSEFIISAGYSTLTEDDIRNAVKGKTKGDAAAALEEKYGIQGAEIDLFPSFVRWLPRFNFRIDVTFQVPAEPSQPTDEAPESESATNSPTPGP